MSTKFGRTVSMCILSHWTKSQCINIVEENISNKEILIVLFAATFDQPLYWKATDIVASKKNNPSENLTNVVVRLGGFHLLMSYLGSVGFIMGSTHDFWTCLCLSSSGSYFNLFGTVNNHFSGNAI